MIAVWVFAILAPALMFSQGTYGRRTRGAANTTNAGVYGGPAVTFQGNLKSLTKKELRIDLDSGEESLVFRISKKTHFLKDGKDIKPGDVPVGTNVAVDAARDPDQKFSALNVIVSPPKPKPADQ
jgi:hypothetical protein